MLTVSEEELRTTVSPEDALKAVELAFRRLAEDKVEQPPVMQLMFPERGGETCIKGAYLRGQPMYGVKVASGFFKNAEEGLPSGSGLMLAFSARTGAPQALLLDNGWLTDLRTAAAGALAAKLLTPQGRPLRVAVLGSGVQARMQLDAISRVRDLKSVSVFNRTAANAERFAKASEYSFPVSARGSVSEAVAGADLIVTTTPSKSAMLSLADVRQSSGSVTIITVGADTPGKQEVAADVLEMIHAKGGKLVADKREQVFKLGDLQHVQSQAARNAVVELGDVVAGKVPGREGNEMILCDLTGVGAQDAAIIEAAVEAVLAARSAKEPPSSRL